MFQILLKIEAAYFTKASIKYKCSSAQLPNAIRLQFSTGNIEHDGPKTRKTGKRPNVEIKSRIDVSVLGLMLKPEQILSSTNGKKRRITFARLKLQSYPAEFQAII
jgi:hypothetical protein